MRDLYVTVGGAVYAWLLHEPHTVRQYVWTLFWLLIFNMAWDYSWDLILGTSGFAMYTLSVSGLSSLLSKELLGSLLLIPLEEEFLFRALPLWLAVRLLRPWALVPIVLITSVVFGFGHEGAIGILFQGVGGITFSLVFLKCGGMRGAFWKPFITAVLLHVAVNGWVELESLITSAAAVSF